MRNYRVFLLFGIICCLLASCNQHYSPQRIELNLAQVIDSMQFSDVFEVEEIIPIKYKGLPDKPYRIKVEQFTKTFYWYGETIDEPFLFLFNSDGSFLTRIEDFPSLIDIRSAQNRLEVLEISSRHFLNPFGRIVQSFEKEPATSPVGFWKLKSGYISSKTIHQDTIMEMMGEEGGVSRYILDWNLDSFEGERSQRTRFFGNFYISEDLIFCDGSIGSSQVNFIYKSKTNSTLLYKYLIGVNGDIVDLPVVGVQGEKLILFIRMEELSKFIKNPLEFGNQDCICVLGI